MLLPFVTQLFAAKLFPFVKMIPPVNDAIEVLFLFSGMGKMRSTLEVS